MFYLNIFPSNAVGSFTGRIDRRYNPKAAIIRNTNLFHTDFVATGLRANGGGLCCYNPICEVNKMGALMHFRLPNRPTLVMHIYIEVSLFNQTQLGDLSFGGYENDGEEHFIY